MTDVVQILWGYCDYLRHDGMSYGNYIEQLSIRDLFILNIDEIIENIQSDYFKIINYKQNNI